MMKAAVLAAVLACAAVALVAEKHESFETFKAEYGRNYATAEEESMRRAVFESNMKLAELANERNPHATFGMTEYADWTEAEFKMRMHNAEKNFEMAQSDWAQKLSSIVPTPPIDTVGAPSSIDWRKKGAVTYVKNQAQCGSCWSFSTTGNIEGQWFLAGNKLTAVSEQELVSCDTIDSGCGGGLPTFAMQWLVQKRNGWITSETDYPYTSGNGNNGQCELPKPNVVHINGQVKIPKHESQMAAWCAEHGPVSIGVAVSQNWAMYKNGTITDCPYGTPDHAVLIVGFDTSANPPYWIIKNSWGAKWGEEGYLKLVYGKNACNIQYEPMSAVVGKIPPPPPPGPGPNPFTPSPFAPPTPPTPPTPPGPSNGNYTRRICTDMACSNCKIVHHQAGECVPRPGHASQSEEGRCDNGQLAMTVWQQSTSCGGSWSTKTFEPTNVCLEQDGGFIMNIC